MSHYFENLLHLALEASPWLLFGLIIAGLLKAFIPQSWLEKHLGGEGIKPMLKAAFFGAPLPLCSCGVIPAALALRRSGASKPSTVSFLVSTPETGVDSVSITYALLGPVMAITRPIAAIASALLSGFLVMKEMPQASSTEQAADNLDCCSSKSSGHQEEPDTTHNCCAPATSCCSNEPAQETSCCSEKTETASIGLIKKAQAGLEYTFKQLFSDIALWLLAGLLFAAAVQTFVPSSFLSDWGSGLLAMIVMILIGVPMYVCATASTPIAAGLILAGISPGTALVFLMAGPATNIGSLGIISKELGKQAVTAYLAGVSITAIAAGLTLDAIVEKFDVNIVAEISTGTHLMPSFVAWGSLLILLTVGLLPALNQQLSKRRKESGTAT